MKNLFITVLLISLVTGVFAQGTCTIEGQVVDQSSGMPLPGVNVIIKGTYYGGATDLEGRFLLTGMSPGIYDIEFSMIGYKIVLKTGVAVATDIPTRISMELEETTLALGQEIVIEGQRPLLEVDKTASSVRLSSDELKLNIVENVSDILAEQVGITSQDNEIHVRGGRVDESMFIVDGISVKDPLSGYSNNLYVNVDAIEELEVITGGFNAEYGQAMSGIINIRIKEGSQKYHGTLAYSSDDFGLSELPWESFNKDRIEFTLSGPEPITSTMNAIGLSLPGKVSFFANAYMHLNDSYLPQAHKLVPSQEWMKKLTFRQENDWHALYKLTWRINDQQKLSASYDRSLNINQGYFMSRFQGSSGFPYPYKEMLDNYNTLTKESILTTLLYTHTLSPKLFYEVTAGRFFTNLHSAVQGKHWTEYEQTTDIEPIYYYQTGIDGSVGIAYGDEFWDHGDAPDWYDYYSDNLSIDFDLNYQPSQRHSFKTGFDHKQSELQVIDIDSPWLGESGLGRNYDYFNVTTDYGSLYLQDRITFDGMIANLGLRYDYWFPGEYLENAIADPEVLTITDAARQKFYDETFEIFNKRGKGHLSPRLGISHPVTDSDVLYFNYGHFSQLPTFNYVYAKLRSTAEATYQLFGNPNLDPKTTVAYEIGIKHKFDDNQVLEIKAFYKDMFDYETSQRVTLFNPRYGHLSYLIYINMDYARSRGIEVKFKRRFARLFSADANLSYSITTGKSSTPLDNLLVEAGRLDEKPLGENFLRWDQPLSIFTNLHFNVGPKDKLSFLGLSLPRNWGISSRIEYESGRRYTAMENVSLREEDGRVYYEGTPNSDTPYTELADPITTVDLKFNKYIQTGALEWKLYCTIENLFDTKRPRMINAFTGQAYDPGEIYSYGYINSPNPNFNEGRYYTPRTIEMGISLRF
ncbi:MAG: TonB-dependent receptor [Candidatus Marinimicrobia bacterium]|nr:TonB-dependent receptor [Candidatus Neomarinimicrobiota bacterium]MCF7850342.1 TonB-dependent receptor [Candidatus Neomarinimicrobiota bacterium]MCF7904949.1 TonB-dependent receptor [Candidatus Neomarinimicrobiota bacterium]